MFSIRKFHMRWFLYIPAEEYIKQLTCATFLTGLYLFPVYASLWLASINFCARIMLSLSRYILASSVYTSLTNFVTKNYALSFKILVKYFFYLFFFEIRLLLIVVNKRLKKRLKSWLIFCCFSAQAPEESAHSIANIIRHHEAEYLASLEVVKCVFLQLNTCIFVFLLPTLTVLFDRHPIQICQIPLSR